MIIILLIHNNTFLIASLVFLDPETGLQALRTLLFLLLLSDFSIP